MQDACTWALLMARKKRFTAGSSPARRTKHEGQERLTPNRFYKTRYSRSIAFTQGCDSSDGRATDCNAIAHKTAQASHTSQNVCRRFDSCSQPNKSVHKRPAGRAAPHIGKNSINKVKAGIHLCFRAIVCGTISAGQLPFKLPQENEHIQSHQSSPAL